MLHDELSQVNEKWQLERGRNVSETGARHRSTEEYRRHLSEECTNIEEQVVQHTKALSDLKVEISLAERRVKGLTSMVDNLRKAKAEKESQLSVLERTLQSHQGDTAAIIAERERLEKELASIQTKLEDKQDKLRTADQQHARSVRGTRSRPGRRNSRISCSFGSSRHQLCFRKHHTCRRPHRSRQNHLRRQLQPSGPHPAGIRCHHYIRRP